MLVEDVGAEGWIVGSVPDVGLTGGILYETGMGLLTEVRSIERRSNGT